DCVADKDHGRTPVSRRPTARATRAAHGSAPRPRAAAAQEHAVLTLRGRNSALPVSASGTPAEASIDDGYPLDNHSGLAINPGFSSAATATEVAVPSDGYAGSRIGAARNRSLNCARPRRSNDQWAIAPIIH